MRFLVATSLSGNDCWEANDTGEVTLEGGVGYHESTTNMSQCYCRDCVLQPYQSSFLVSAAWET